MRTSAFSGKRYFVTCIDDKSRYCVVYLIKKKSKVKDKFSNFVALAEKQTGKRVKNPRRDNGGEYASQKMAKFCSDQGILLKYTPPYTPHLNGVAKRMNRTLVECARCMLEHAGLAKHYWGEAVMTAMFPRNRCPSRPREVAIRDLDDEETAVSKPQGVWVSRVRTYSKRKTFKAGRKSRIVPIFGLFGAREDVSF